MDSHGGAPDGEQHDLAHLVGLNKLESLSLNGSYVHAEALESLPSLQKLQLIGCTLDDMSVLDRLRARGGRPVLQTRKSGENACVAAYDAARVWACVGIV